MDVPGATRVFIAAERRTSLRIRFGRGFWTSRVGLILLGTAVFLLLVATGLGTYYWISYGRMIDLRLSGHIQQTTARIYAAPMRIYTGESLTVADLADHLQRAGYSELDVSGTPGRYILHGNSIEIHPSNESLFGVKDRLIVEFSGPEIHKIRSMETA